MNPVSRLHYARIVYRLLTSPSGYPVHQLQRDLEVAPRTWRKYRQVLEEQFEPFHEGGHTRLRVVEEGGQRWLRLAEPAAREASSSLVARLAAFRLAGRVVGALGEDFRHAVNDAFAALGRGRRSKPTQRLLARVHRDLDRLLYFVPHAPKDYRDQAVVIEALLEALVQHRRIELDYEASNGPAATHELEPLTLALHQGGLYLLARYPARPGKERRVYNFVVDRIVSIVVGESSFPYPRRSEYHPERVLAGSFGIFFTASGGETRKVELLFADKRWLHTYLLERRWHPTQSFRRRRDGRLRLSLEVTNLVEIAQWVRGFGDDVEVLRPKGLLESR